MLLSPDVHCGWWCRGYKCIRWIEAVFGGDGAPGSAFLGTAVDVVFFSLEVPFFKF